MKNLIQIHAMPSEFFSWLEIFLEKNKKIKKYFFFKQNGTIYAISLYYEIIDCNINTSHLFLSNFPDSLTIIIGEESPSSLRQSSISFQTENSELIECWKNFIKIVKNNSNAGLKVIGTDGIEYDIKKTFRISSGAHKFYLSGKELLAFAGGVKFIPLNPS